MSAALAILQKLRKYELEAEEHQLQMRQREVSQKHLLFLTAQETLRDALEVKASLPLTPQWIRLEPYLCEADQHQVSANQQWEISQKERDQQLEKTLLAKRRLDMMDRLLERRHSEAELIRDQVERKQLDDVTQSRHVLMTMVTV